jgi:NSS family neurotransmitter:Na+ symporter
VGKSSIETWKRESGYIWSMIGSAVGFANILGFGSQCYFHGGGAFLIPFTIAAIVLGIPLLILEGTIGQRLCLPLVSAYGKVIGGKGRFLGWLSILSCLTIGAFYVVLTGWSVAYIYFSGAGSIPVDTATFFKTTFLQDTGSVLNFGPLSWPILISTLVVAAFSWYVLLKNIQAGIERICSFFLPLLALIILGFFIAVCFLPGASEGFKHYLLPDFSQLYSISLWRDTFGHLFFSLSLALGIVTGYSRYTSQAISIPRAMVFVVLGDFLISFFAGFAVFGCIGYMSYLQKIPFTDIIKADSIFEIGFVVFPAIVHTFGSIAHIIGPIFFFCVFIAGVTGVFSIVESIAGNIEIEFGRSRKAAVSIASIVMTLFATLFCFGNGQHIVAALSPMVIGINSLLGGLAEIIVFMYCSKVIRDDTTWFSASGKRTYAYYSLRYFITILLFLIFVASIMNEAKTDFGYPELIRWCWFIGAVICSYVLAKYGHIRTMRK